MKNVTKLIQGNQKASLLLLAILFLASCTYFQVKKTHAESLSKVVEIGKIYKYFVVHDAKGNLYALENISVDEQSLSGDFTSDLPEPVYYREQTPQRYKYEEKPILHEVHLYLSGVDSIAEGAGTISLDKVNEVRIIEKDKKRTVASYVWTSIGAVAGTFAVVVAIAALLKDSCPYVYVHDGDGFIFLGETYGGAIASNLEREDYMPLPGIRAVDNTFKVRISNELKEKQHTNMAKLILAQHPEGSQILLDRQGNPCLLQDLQAPLSATTASGADIAADMQAIDQSIFMFNETTVADNHIHLTFKKPADAQQANLFLHAKNTPWFDYLIGKMFENFGGMYNTFMDSEQDRPAAERLADFKAKKIMLEVFVKTDTGWEFVDYLPTIGPMASRDFVLPIDLVQVTGEEVELKIKTGFMFWDVDCVKMDFSTSEDIVLREINPSLVIDQDGNNQTAVLSKADDQYLIQPQVGDVAELHYPAIAPASGFTQSVFLHTQGYYEPIRDFEGMPNVTELYKFKAPHYLSDYSKALYLDYLEGYDGLVVQ